MLRRAVVWWLALMLALPLRAAAWMRPNGRDTLCNQVYPAEGGIWKDSPPFWTLPNCSTQMFTQDNVKKCMKGRTLYVIGNSVARQNAFNMVELLGGEAVSRELQKRMCPKHETTWDASCFQEFEGVKIRYLHLQFFDGFFYGNRSGFPYFRYGQMDPHGNYKVVTDRLPGANETYGISANESPTWAGTFWTDENCIDQNTRTCIRRFFRGSTPQDVLIFTAGMSTTLPSPEEALERDARALKGHLEVDMTAWFTASASAFLTHVAASFSGNVFQVMMAEANSKKYLAPRSPSFERANRVLYSLTVGATHEQPWFVIDQWAINTGRQHLYNDHVHFNGPLSHATLYQVLNELCPGGGESTTWPDRTLALSVLVTRDPRASEQKIFFVDSNGLRRDVVMGPDGSPPKYLESLLHRAFTWEHVQLVYAAGSAMPYIGNNTVIRGDGRQLYVLLDDRRRAFPSAEVYFRNGYSFEQVVYVGNHVISLIPEGPDMQ